MVAAATSLASAVEFCSSHFAPKSRHHGRGERGEGIRGCEVPKVVASAGEEGEEGESGGERGELRGEGVGRGDLSPGRRDPTHGARDTRYHHGLPPPPLPPAVVASFPRLPPWPSSCLPRPKASACPIEEVRERVSRKPNAAVEDGGGGGSGPQQSMWRRGAHPVTPSPTSSGTTLSPPMHRGEWSIRWIYSILMGTQFYCT
jgi:hypothetical protein